MNSLLKKVCLSLLVCSAFFTINSDLSIKVCLAGDQLTPQSLVSKSDAIALVTFRLKDKSIKIDEWLFLGESLGTRDQLEKKLKDSASSLSVLCLPQKDTLQLWIKRYPNRREALKQWRRAIKTGFYTGYLYLKLQGPNQLSALCETETLDAKHWLSHPSFHAWREALLIWSSIKVKEKIAYPSEYAVQTTNHPQAESFGTESTITLRQMIVGRWKTDQDQSLLEVGQKLPFPVFLAMIRSHLLSTSEEQHLMASDSGFIKIFGEPWRSVFCEELRRRLELDLLPEVVKDQSKEPVPTWFKSLVNQTPQAQALNHLATSMGWSVELEIGSLNQQSRCHEAHLNFPYDVSNFSWRFTRLKE